MPAPGTQPRKGPEFTLDVDRARRASRPEERHEERAREVDQRREARSEHAAERREHARRTQARAERETAHRTGAAAETPGARENSRGAAEEPTAAEAPSAGADAAAERTEARPSTEAGARTDQPAAAGAARNSDEGAGPEAGPESGARRTAGDTAATAASLVGPANPLGVRAPRAVAATTPEALAGAEPAAAGGVLEIPGLEAPTAGIEGAEPSEPGDAPPEPARLGDAAGARAARNTPGAVHHAASTDAAATAPRAEAAGLDGASAKRTDAAMPARAEARPAAAAPAMDQAADVLRQVRVYLTPGMRQATLQLEPATLGRISIRIAMREGRARTEVRAEKASALEALQRHVPELRAALERQGIEAGEFDLSLGFGGERGEPSGHSSGSAGRGDAASASGAEPVTARLASPALTRALLDDSGVDTYA